MQGVFVLESAGGRCAACAIFRRTEIIARIILSAIYVGNEPQKRSHTFFISLIYASVFQYFCKDLAHFLFKDLGGIFIGKGILAL